MEHTNLARPIYIVDGARTPFLKAQTKRGPFAAADLAVVAGRQLLASQPIHAEDIDEVVIGCMMPSEDEANIGRIIAMRLGCGDKTPGWTVQRNCASGLQSVASAMKDIALGHSDLVLAGGTEAMSRAPLLFQPDAVNWFSSFMRAKTAMDKAKLITHIKPRYFSPIIALLHGLSDPLCGYNMGQTAEQIAYQFGITRHDMDEFSVMSHQRLALAFDQQVFRHSLAPLYANNGHLYTEDTGLRRDSSTDRLAKLKPVFDRKYGMVTPGNSSQVTDGSAMVLLASEKAVEQYGLNVRGRIVDVQWSGLDPKVMGLGPVFAATPMLMRNRLGVNDVDYWEINEAFAAQVIGCVRAWEDADFCRQHFGLDAAFGSLSLDRLNIDGGAIAMGHPVGASGSRLLVQLMDILERKQAKRGVATLCIGGGQGGAMLVERV